nr:ribonuclease H-like domain-containing protein [Tanacetum cinerariifolium]
MQSEPIITSTSHATRSTMTIESTGGQQAKLLRASAELPMPSLTVAAQSEISSGAAIGVAKADWIEDPNWRNAMYDEYNALVKYGTCLLVPRLTGVNMVHSMWLFKHKFHADETLSRYKARIFANGSSQQLGVDFDETFSLVVKPATIRTVLSLALCHQWPIYQLNVKNAFLNGDLSETIYMYQPPGFVDNWFVFSQKKYALQLFGCAHMVTCNPSRTPVDTKSKLGLEEPHLAALKCILRYVQDTLDLGLHLYASSSTSLVGYTDVDWAGCPSTRSAEAEYQGVTNVVA